MFEIAESVEYHEDIGEAIRRNPRAKTFLLSPPLMDPKGGGAKRELFSFLVACSLIAKIKETEKEKLNKLLETVRIRFFADGDLYNCCLSLKDINNVTEKIFK